MPFLRKCLAKACSSIHSGCLSFSVCSFCSNVWKQSAVGQLYVVLVAVASGHAQPSQHVRSWHYHSDVPNISHYDAFTVVSHQCHKDLTLWGITPWDTPGTQMWASSITWRNIYLPFQNRYILFKREHCKSEKTGVLDLGHSSLYHTRNQHYEWVIIQINYKRLLEIVWAYCDVTV